MTSERNTEAKVSTGRGSKRRAAAIVVLLVCGGLLGSGWMVVGAVRVKGDLMRAARLVGQMERQMRAGDVEAAQRSLAALQAQTRAARSGTAGVGWRVAETAPALGGNATAVRTLSVALDDLATKALPPLVQAATLVDLTKALPRDGRVDLDRLQAAAPLLEKAHAGLRDIRTQAMTIRLNHTLARIQDAVTAFRAGVGRLEEVTGTASRAAALLPPMLGASGPRTYLVLVQNLAELRATGGIPGAFAVVRAERGSFRLVRQGTAATDLRTFDRPVLWLEPGMTPLYTDRVGRYPADINLTPHFPTTARLAREMYRRRTGQAVDGVLAVDPVALSYLLRAMPPVSVPGGPSLTADSAVATLLSDTYRRTDDPVAQDEYFAAAADAVFGTLSAGAVDPRQALAGLAKAAGERRILLWSADDDEQDAIADTVLAGALPERDDTRPTVGVFLNDGSGAKLGYYLRMAADLRVVRCRSDGRRELAVRVTLSSTAPRAGLPRYVTGLALAGDPYTARTNVLLFSPIDGAVVAARLDGSDTAVGTGAERGRMVSVVTVDVSPGQSRTLEATLLTPPMPVAKGVRVSADLWLTPMASPWRKSVGPEHSCG